VEGKPIRGSGGKAPSGVQGQSPWSGGSAGFPPETESVLTLDHAKKVANLPLLLFYTVLKTIFNYVKTTKNKSRCDGLFLVIMNVGVESLCHRFVFLITFIYEQCPLPVPCIIHWSINYRVDFIVFLQITLK